MYLAKSQQTEKQVLGSFRRTKPQPSVEVVSAATLVKVFGKKKPPFEINPDGSVDKPVYMVWLNEAGVKALKAFEDCFMTDEPLKKEVSA